MRAHHHQRGTGTVGEREDGELVAHRVEEDLGAGLAGGIGENATGLSVLGRSTEPGDAAARCRAAGGDLFEERVERAGRRSCVRN